MDGSKPRYWTRLLHLWKVSNGLNEVYQVSLMLPSNNVRSIHNIRIERLWYEVTRAVSSIWKLFFETLEFRDGLNPALESHIWLIHYLFLDSINAELEDWVRGWNNHHMNVSGRRTPRQMFLMSMLRDGPRGLELLDGTTEDSIVGEDHSRYGIDWDEVTDTDESRGTVTPGQYSGLTQLPDLSNVECEAPGCPLDREQLEAFQRALAPRLDPARSDPEYRRRLWCEGLQLLEWVMSE